MLSEVLERCLREIQTPAPLPVVVQAPPPRIDLFAATQKQIEYFKALVAGKDLTDQCQIEFMTSLPKLNKRAMTETIRWLIALPWKPHPPQISTMPIVPGPAPTIGLKTQGPVWNGRQTANGIAQGYYAVVDPVDQVLKFYQVRRPTQGKWAGYVFISQVTGDNKLPMRHRLERERIFTEIQKDMMGASKRFGKEIGQCGHCRKQLTDVESREFGIGPVCRKALGI